METRSKAGNRKRKQRSRSGDPPATKRVQRRKNNRSPPPPPAAPGPESIASKNPFDVLSTHGGSPPTLGMTGLVLSSTPAPATPEILPNDSASQHSDESEISYLSLDESETSRKGPDAGAVVVKDESTTPTPLCDERPPVHPAQGSPTPQPITRETCAPPGPVSVPGPRNLMAARREARGLVQGRVATMTLAEYAIANKENVAAPGPTTRSYLEAATLTQRSADANPFLRHDSAATDSLLLAPAVAVPPQPIAFLPPLVVPPYAAAHDDATNTIARPATPAPALLQKRDKGKGRAERPTHKAKTVIKVTREDLLRARLPVGSPMVRLGTTIAPLAKPPRAAESMHQRAIRADSPSARVSLPPPTASSIAGPSTRPAPATEVDGALRGSTIASSTRPSALQVLAEAASQARMRALDDDDDTPKPPARTAPPMTPLFDLTDSLVPPLTTNSLPRLAPPHPDVRLEAVAERDDLATPDDRGVLTATLEDYVASHSATLGPTRDTAMTITPTPPSGFPNHQGSRPGWQLANQTKESLVGWLGIPGGKALAVPFGQGANDYKLADRLFSTVAHIQQATARFLGIPTVHVAPPIAEKPVTDLNQAPYAFLVHGISPGRAAQLVSQQCVSTPNVTILFFPLAFSLPTVFVNFGHIIDCGSDMVRNMAIATMTRGPNFNAITELLRETPGLPTSMDFEELARRLINTVRITGSARYGRGAVLTPVYSLSMSTTLMNAVTWHQWHQLLNSFKWSDIFLAEVAIRSDVECEGCHGCDHYQHACPYMQVPGWHGTMPLPLRRGLPTAPHARMAPTHAAGATGPPGPAPPARPIRGLRPPMRTKVAK